MNRVIKRELSDVIERILNIIPERQYIILHRELTSIAISSRFSAPEMQSYWWKKAQHNLDIYLFNDRLTNSSFVEEVRLIWTGEK